MIEVVAKSKQTSGILVGLSYLLTRDNAGGTDTRRHIAPAWLRVALSRIWRSGPAGELIMSSRFPGTNSKTIKNIAPVKVPIPTQ